jgi:hypothetical protein
MGIPVRQISIALLYCFFCCLFFLNRMIANPIAVGIPILFQNMLISIANHSKPRMGTAMNISVAWFGG